MPTERPPSIDSLAAARWRAVAPAPSPWLHEEVARRMQERLDIIRLKPAAWAHWEPLIGGMAAHELLARRYPDAECFMAFGQEIQAQSAAKYVAKPWWKVLGRKAPITHYEVPPEGAVQMLWANMALHLAADPQALIAQWHRALAVDGFLMFSCLGPDTLREIRSLYAQLGWPAPSHEFTDMHDWGDMLVSAGFAEPVLDMERITLTYETPERLLAELRTLGRNLNIARFGALRGRGWLRRLHSALCEHLADPLDGGRLKLSFEVIYGHAIKPARRLAVGPQTNVTLEEMRTLLRSGKGGHP